MDFSNHANKIKKTIIILAVAGVLCFIANSFVMTAEMNNESFGLGSTVAEMILCVGGMLCIMAAIFIFLRNQLVSKSAKNSGKSNIADVVGDISTVKPDYSVFSWMFYSYKLYLGEKGFYIDSPGICLPYASVKAIGTMPYRYKAINTSPSVRDLLENPDKAEVFRFHLWFQTEDGTKFLTHPTEYHDAAVILKLITDRMGNAK